jgi:hypothetical protein
VEPEGDLLGIHVGTPEPVEEGEKQSPIERVGHPPMVVEFAIGIDGCLERDVRRLAKGYMELFLQIAKSLMLNSDGMFKSVDPNWAGSRTAQWKNEMECQLLLVLDPFIVVLITPQFVVHAVNVLSDAKPYFAVDLRFPIEDSNRETVVAHRHEAALERLAEMRHPGERGMAVPEGEPRIPLGGIPFELPPPSQRPRPRRSQSDLVHFSTSMQQRRLVMSWAPSILGWMMNMRRELCYNSWLNASPRPRRDRDGQCDFGACSCRKLVSSRTVTQPSRPMTRTFSRITKYSVCFDKGENNTASEDLAPAESRRTW